MRLTRDENRQDEEEQSVARLITGPRIIGFLVVSLASALIVAGQYQALKVAREETTLILDQKVRELKTYIASNEAAIFQLQRSFEENGKQQVQNQIELVRKIGFIEGRLESLPATAKRRE